MTLRDLIARLEAEDPRKVCPLGFGRPDSSMPTFPPAEGVTVAAMIASTLAVDSKWLTSSCLIHCQGQRATDLTAGMLDFLLAAGTVPGEEIEGWAFDERGDRKGSPVARLSGEVEVGFGGAVLDIEAFGAAGFDLPIAVIDRLRAMRRERHGA